MLETVWWLAGQFPSWLFSFMALSIGSDQRQRVCSEIDLMSSTRLMGLFCLYILNWKFIFPPERKTDLFNDDSFGDQWPCGLRKKEFTSDVVSTPCWSMQKRAWLCFGKQYTLSITPFFKVNPWVTGVLPLEGKVITFWIIHRVIEKLSWIVSL